MLDTASYICTPLQ